MDFSALSALFAPLTGFLDAHPAVVACLVGWMGALGVTQAVKQIVVPGWFSTTATKRISQLVAIASGTAFAFALWPIGGAHRLAYSLVVGMSAPTAYTLLKALIEWRFPRLAYLLSWQRVQDREAAATRLDDGCGIPPEGRPADDRAP